MDISNDTSYSSGKSEVVVVVVTVYNENHVETSMSVEKDSKNVGQNRRNAQW